MTTQFQDIPDVLPKPWHWDDIDLTKQLHKEISRKHVLFSRPLKTIGRRQDNDDVLFQLENGDFKYAVVHLTWSQKKVKDSRFPKTKLYKDWNDLYTNRILLDSIGFE
jgi:hypothetical protein